MSQIILATFEDGVLKPEETLGLPAGTKVRLTLDVRSNGQTEIQEACAALDLLCDELPVHSHGLRLTRDQLHERR